MNQGTNIVNRVSTTWDLGRVVVSHNVMDYDAVGVNKASNSTEFVRLHFGLKGKYHCRFDQLGCSFALSGHHNNMLYSDGLEITVENQSKRIETFGVNFTKDAFLEIAQNGNAPLKQLAAKVQKRENALLSPHWKGNTFKIQQVIQEMIHCPYSEDLRSLFLFSKSVELLVLQADLYDEEKAQSYIKTNRDRAQLVQAKEILESRMVNPPSLSELAQLVGLNEYKLKRGFKELFGTTVFGWIHASRMNQAKNLLLSTTMSAKEIAFDMGYCSPQHFSKAFKKEFGVPPNRVRNTPDFTTD